MIAVVTNDVVVASAKASDNARVYSKACREAERFILTHKLGNLLFEHDMKVERTIQEAASSTARTVLIECVLRSLDNALIAGKTSVSV